MLDFIFSFWFLATLFAISVVFVIGGVWWDKHDPFASKSHAVPVHYLNARMAVRPHILGHSAPDGYRLASLYFGTGMIDRTGTLDHGFSYAVLDPIPAFPTGTRIEPDIGRLCDARAREIVARAQRENKKIRLLWSGGIDSTAAGVALIRATAAMPKLLEFAYTPASRKEYPHFFHEQIKGRFARKKFSKVSDALDPDMIIVTGEHGDQLFGSVVAASYTDTELAAPWKQTILQRAGQTFATPDRADEMVRYLEPQLAQCPIPLTTTFDLLWWLNFSLKWQSVTLRLCVAAPNLGYADIYAVTEHFFRPEPFQLWSLANPDQKIKATWNTYKWPLKEYIYLGTGDRSYRDQKTKEPSLRGLLHTPGRGKALAVDANNKLLFQPADDSLKKPRNASDGGASYGESGVSFTYESEAPLWDAVDGSDGGE